MQQEDKQVEQDKVKQKTKQFYKIITGDRKYVDIPWDDGEVEPDLIMTMKLDSLEYIEKGKFFTVAKFITSPNYYLNKAYEEAEKNILKEMARQKQNQSTTSIKIRLQQSIKQRDQGSCIGRYYDQHGKLHQFQIECIHEKHAILDGFTLQYNALIYTLQQVCGFKVRSFIIYDEEIKNKKLFIFLNLGIENRLRLAAKYSMKKQIQYSFIDFFINEPYGGAKRPLKLHFSQQSHDAQTQFFKKNSRFFGIADPHLGKQILQEADIPMQTQYKFWRQTQEMQTLLSYYQKHRQPEIDKYDKQYIFEYNNNKINKGCKLLYHRIEQRKQYFQLMEYLSPYHGFKSIRAPEMFQDFMIATKGFSGAGYFQRLKSILLYKPQNVSADGRLDLFLKMEKIKLAYLVLKSTFKVNVLEQMGIKFLALPDDFELKGKGGTEEIAGGVDGQNVRDSWTPYTVFSSTNVIRNYFGNSVGLQISFKVYLLYFFLAIAVPYGMIFILEKLFKSLVYGATNQLKTVLLAVCFRIYLDMWTMFEDNYVDKFKDQVSSKVFRSQFRGPYIRNVQNDNINEYAKAGMIQDLFKNLICAFFLFAVFGLFGILFYALRLLLIEIYDPLAGFQVDNVSLPHFLVYGIFFVVQQMFEYFATGKVIDLMIWIKNPPSDDDKRQLSHYFKFFYLFGIELIAPTFFFVIEPFQRTTCYAEDCISQIQLYVYSRYLILIIELCGRSVSLLYFKSKAGIKKKIEQQQHEAVKGDSFEAKIAQMLIKADEEDSKPVHQNSNTIDIISIIDYGIYNILIPLQVPILLVNNMINCFNTRTYLMNFERRTVSRSQSILIRKHHLLMIYYVSIVMNSWQSIMIITFIEKDNPTLVPLILTSINHDTIFILKLFFVVLETFLTLGIGEIASMATKSAMNYWIDKRSRMKFHQYWARGHTRKQKSSKVEPPLIPKTIFRTDNPKTMEHQLVGNKLLEEYNIMPKHKNQQLHQYHQNSSHSLAINKTET